ncbi:hypothetical protein MAIC_02490 [Mycolicibacterium aichiense]|uniref:Uncharacterized protein n=1 Tax=Mycolicibacterium aichiense TaxID=1799 RepID=A0AAD1MAA1_9MYCO|nr:hypothetical protein MAIC_02490 [Mycolicibacterium aichiense]
MANARLKALPAGPTADTKMRTVLTRTHGLVARFDAVRANGIRETKTARPQPKLARALTAFDFEQVRQALQKIHRAQVMDCGGHLQYLSTSSCWRRPSPGGRGAGC